MNILPPFKLEKHIDNLLMRLRKFFPEIRMSDFVYLDDSNNLPASRVVKRESLMDVDEFSIFFQKLCSEGREWINISGDSWLDNRFLVLIEYSQKTGSSSTSVIVSGPSLDANKLPLLHTRLNIL